MKHTDESARGTVAVLRRRRHCGPRVAFRVTLCAVICLAALPVLGGCGGNKKSALTEEEIARLTYAPKPQRPDQLMVSGEPIRCENIMTFGPDESEAGPTLRDWLEEVARKTTFSQFMELAWPRVQQRLNSSISSIVLAQRARRELGDQAEDMLDKEAEKELRRYIVEEHGGNEAQADEALRQKGMNRAGYKQWRIKQILARIMVSSRYARNRPITRGELLARYEATKDEHFRRQGVLQFRLIDIQINQVAREDPNMDPLARARALARELRRRIDAGEDFGELAQQYSHGHRSARGGLWEPRDPVALAAPYDVVAEAAKTMEPGRVDGPIEAIGHIFIVKVEAKQEAGYQPLTEVQDKVREDILEERWKEVSAELDREIQRQAALADTEPFLEHCLQTLYRQANESSPAP